MTSSGTVLCTAYNLFSLNYNVYVISNNTIEAGSSVPGLNVDQAIKQGIIPKIPAQVITLEQALGALNRSGPATWGNKFSAGS